MKTTVCWRNKFFSFSIIAFLILSITGCTPGGWSTPSTSETTMAVCLRGSGQIAIIDTKSDTILTLYPVGTGPQSIAISPDKNTFYVTDNPDSWSGSPPSCLHVVRVSDGVVLQTIPLGGRPWGVKVHPDGTRVYVSLYSTDEVVVVNTTTYNIDHRISVGNKPTGIAISPDGSKLAVPNKDDNTISVIDTNTLAVSTSSTTRGTGDGPWELAFSPDGTQIWVDDSDDGNKIMIYSPNTLAELNYTTVTFPFNGSDGGVHGFAFTPDGTKVFAGSAYAPEMFVLNASNMNVLYTIDTLTTDGGYAKRLAMSQNGAKLYYSSHDDDTITIIDTSTYAILNTIYFDSGDYPEGMVIY